MDTDTSNAAVNSFFSSVRSFLIVMGTILAGYGFTSKSPIYFWTEAIAGSIMVVGPAAYSMYVAAMRVINDRKKTTIAVNATMALAASGNMIVDRTGTPVKATEESAAQIVKDYASQKA